MSQLYADENFDIAVVERLRLLGHDVLTVQEAGQQGGADHEVLAYAAARVRAVLTLNRRHFIKLHSKSTAHAGIIVCTAGDADALAARIDQAITLSLPLANQLIRIDLPP